MRRCLFLSVLMLVTVGVSAKLPAPDCQSRLQAPLPLAGDPSFVKARRELVACFLQTRGEALATGKSTQLDVDLEKKVKDDVTSLAARRDDLNGLLKVATTKGQTDLLNEQLAIVAAGLAEEGPYVGGVPPAPDAPKSAEGPGNATGAAGPGNTAGGKHPEGPNPAESQKPAEGTKYAEGPRSSEGARSDQEHRSDEGPRSGEWHRSAEGSRNAGGAQSSAEATPPCNCKDPLTDIETGLALDPGDLGFVDGRRTLSECLHTLRKTALADYAADKSPCAAPEPCDKRIDAVETLVVAETKKLLGQRDALAKDFATARTRREADLKEDQLVAVKGAIQALEPFVTVAGTDVTIKTGDFQARRKLHEAKNADATQEKACIDRYAYLDVTTEPDPAGLIDCVNRMRGLCRKAPVNRVSCSNVVDLSVNECELNLSRLEQKLREYAGDQLKQLGKLKAAHDALTGDEKTKNDVAQKAVSDRLDSIRKIEVIPDEGELSEYSDYKQWWAKFSLGYEYVSLNSAFTKGFPRMGVAVGLNLPRQAVPDVSLHNWHLKSYGIFTTFALGLTNTAEETKTSFTTTPGGEGAKNALAVEEQIFLPWWRSDLDPQDRRLRTWFGPIFTAGGRKTDQDNFLSPRYYAGFRLARSPEMYSDWMFGRSGDLRSHRLEVRGQFPIFRFDNGSRLVAGAIGNFGINQRKHQALCTADPDNHIEPTRTCDELDSIRFYLTYDITAETLKKIFGGEK